MPLPRSAPNISGTVFLLTVLLITRTTAPKPAIPPPELPARLPVTVLRRTVTAPPLA